MHIIKFFQNCFKKIIEIVLAVIVWILLVIMFANLINWINTQHYQPHDTPDKRFSVLALNENNIEFPQSWKSIKNQPKSWVRKGVKQGQEACHLEDCLIEMKNGNFKYHNEGALWYTESEYRINADSIVPVSFLFFTFIHCMLAMALAFIGIILGKYSFNQWRFRDSVSIKENDNK